MKWTKIKDNVWKSDSGTVIIRKKVVMRKHVVRYIKSASHYMGGEDVGYRMRIRTWKYTIGRERFDYLRDAKAFAEETIFGQQMLTKKESPQSLSP